MNRIAVAATALNQTPLDWAANRGNIGACLREVRDAGASLVCLPELCVTGYGCEDAFHAPDTIARAWASLRALLPETRGLVACIGLPVVHRGAAYNAVALAADGCLAGLVAKRHLAGDGIHYEPRWFKPWPAGLRDTFQPPDGGEGVPIGDLLFEVGGIGIGFEICEDAWVANRPGGALAGLGAEVILNPSASHFAFGKREVRRRFVLEGSRAFSVTYVYSNLLGNESGRAIFDGQMMVASAGRMLGEGSRFSFAERAILVRGADVDLTRFGKVRTGSFRPAIPSADHPSVCRVPFEWPAVREDLAEGVLIPEWENGEDLKEEEFARAVALGLFDYARKSRAAGFVVSLSGGCDSSAAVALAWWMVRAARGELGPEEFARRLGACAGDGDPVRGLLATVYQPTENSSATTRAAARALAEAVGSAHYEFDLGAIHRGYVSMIEGALGRRLDWAGEDLALQNIQARVRSPGAWMLANLRGALLLSTSNRSEAAVGYATMDGDTSGSIAPLAGVDKAWLQRWLRWMEADGPRLGEGRANLPALAAVNVQQPTAELRPAGAGQTDETDLMPYGVLDFIERAAIRDKRSPVDVFALVRRAFPDAGAGEARGWVIRFFRLWSRNQWKRERYAPSFHLDDENLDPKTWCRWPILSGGFAEELAELESLNL